MQWMTKIPKPIISPQIGEKREKKSFAFLPTCLNNGKTVWLETFIKLQEYSTLGGEIWESHGIEFYEYNKWVTIEKIKYKN